MHRMTRDGRTAAVRAPFDGTELHYHDDVARLERRGDDRFVHLERAGQRPEDYRVTRVVGGRTREDFVGVDERGSDEVVLPISYVFATGALRPKGYSVMVRERSGLAAGPAWSRACIACHNTLPEIDRLLGAVAGHGPAYQVQQVDSWLAPACYGVSPCEDRRLGLHVRDAEGFRRAVQREVEAVGGGALVAVGPAPEAVARAAVEAIRPRIGGDTLLEEGIGCEACHGGGRSHADNPRVPMTLVPQASWLAVSPTSPAAFQNHVCARCHQVLFSKYPFTWEGGRRDRAPGGSSINSGEGRDFLLGACSGELTCTQCHEPHAGGLRDASLQTQGGNRVCTGCHGNLAAPAALQGHSHHEPSGRGASCVACHMPRKNMGLTGMLTTYHRIGSPTDPARVLGDRPIECALCHVGKTVRGLVDVMEAWWPVRYPRQRLEEMYGPLEQRVLDATVLHGKPHEKAAAMAALADGQATGAVPLIAGALLDPYPLVRDWAKHALERLGHPCPVDLAADDDAIARAASSCAGHPVQAVAPSQSAALEEPED